MRTDQPVEPKKKKTIMDSDDEPEKDDEDKVQSFVSSLLNC